MDSFGENGASEMQLVLATGDMVDSPTRITLENNGKIRPQPDRENAFAGASGGGDGPGDEPSLPAKLLQSLQKA